MAAMKPSKIRFAALNPLQPRFPFAGHRRTLDRRLHRLDQPNAALGGIQRLAVAGQILALEQGFDGVGASGRRAQSAVLHRRRQFLVLQRAGRRFPSRSKVASVKRGGGRVCLATARASSTCCGWPTVRPGGRFCSASFSSFSAPVAALALRLPAGLFPSPGRNFRHLQHFPADLLHRRAAAVIAIDHGRAVRFRAGDRGDQGGHRPDVIVVPGHQQAAADQVVNLPFVGARAARAM
jgi:hypothetical protein